MPYTALGALLEAIDAETLVDVIGILERRELQYEADGDSERACRIGELVALVKAELYDRQLYLHATMPTAGEAPQGA